MDRPEWIVVSPKDGQVYCTLTNNAKRGEDGQPVGGPNPREERLRADPALAHRPRRSWPEDVRLGPVRGRGNPGVHAGTPKGGSSNITAQNMFNSPTGWVSTRPGACGF
jgi:secreted PhoX family phosphatase